ncbi:hypothetical protein [Synoicihabitans lomoniglobus]|uniref:DUF4340 domain-containing protein n=1 Tax=Synoicihabitans lomoniglobus TaxID=2909285 RepID=A0AAF0CG47_9BACT|nr:hypothetical protein [Opitutaceae bacterium LMO-M01]WED63167.1 hypothetical protein PXH66_12585 [Opitutaceae bacterium LMO-M01]
MNFTASSRACRATMGLLTAVPAMAESQPTPVTVTSQPQFQLFVGTELLVDLAGDPAPVESFGRDVFVARTADGPRRLPVETLDQVRVKSRVRLTERLATVTDLRGKPTIARATRSSDTSGQLSRMVMSNLQQQQQSGQDLAIMAAEDQNSALAEMSESYQSRPFDTQMPDLTTSDGSVRVTEASPIAIWQRDDWDRRPPTDREVDAYGNALEVSCEISTSRPVDSPWGAWICLVRDPQRNVRELQVLRLHRLPSLGPAPRRISQQLRGFPPGFELQEVRLALYDEVGEWATSVSPRRYAITAPQAREYLITEYTTDHRRATTPPVPMRDLASLWRELTTSGLSPQQKFRVEIDATGIAGAVELVDPTPTADVEAYQTYLQHVIFYPALSQGSPVAGIFRGTLPDLR